MGNKMCGRGGRGGEEAASSYIDIPQDLYGEILYRLPTNDLLNFKLVCKDWLRLISSKPFIQKHLQRSKADCSNLRIVLQSYSTAKIIASAKNTSKLILYSGRDQRQVLGCCDGLVLYYNHCHSKIVASSPCTGESLLLAPLPDQDRRRLRPFMWTFSWFGHHPSIGEYVLVLAFGESKRTIKLEVYSLSLDRNDINLPLLSSSTLDEPGLDIALLRHCNRIWTSLHGRLHCPAVIGNNNDFSVKSVILVYDFGTNKITRMTPPAIHGLHDLSMTLGVVGACLCVIQRKEVWRMMEYGVEESWTEYANLDGFPLAFCPDGDVVSITGDHNILVRKVSKYNLREREAKILCETTVKIVYGLVALGCLDSLVSPTLLWREDE